MPCTSLGYHWALPWPVPVSVCTDNKPARSACVQECWQLLREWSHTFCHSLPVTWLEQKNCQLTRKLWLWWSYTGSDLTSFICPLPRCNLSSQNTPLKWACLFPEKKTMLVVSLLSTSISYPPHNCCDLSFSEKHATVSMRCHLLLTCP